MATTSRFTLIPAVHLFLIRDQKILLSRRFQTGYEDGKYSLVAGHVDGDEPARQALAREAQEEAGIVIQPDQLQLAHVMHRRSDSERIDFFFWTADWQGQPRIMEPDKCDDLHWFPIAQLPANTVPYVRAAIEAWQRHQAYSEFGWTG